MALAEPIRNEEEKDKNNNDMLHEKQSLLNNRTASITQPGVDE
ncbi:19255_t:CDS:1, partial [Racocetra fulgida]